MSNPHPKTEHLIQFTSSTGHAAGVRSAQIRLELLENGKRYADLARMEENAKAAKTDESAFEVQQQIALCQEQITRVRALLNNDTLDYCEECERGGMDGKERAALLREYRCIMEHLCMLRGIAPPKAGRGSSSVQRPPVTAPVVAPTQPIVVAPANPGSTGPQST